MRVDLDALDKKYEHELYITPVPISVVKLLSKELRAARGVISAVKIMDTFLYGLLSGEDSWQDFDGQALHTLKHEIENYAKIVGENYEFKSTKFKKEENVNSTTENKNQYENKKDNLDPDVDSYDDDWY